LNQLPMKFISYENCFSNDNIPALLVKGDGSPGSAQPVAADAASLIG